MGVYTKKFDIFISYASPDNEEFVLPLAEELQARGVRVWIDIWEIKLGDKISVSISKGLTDSTFGVVVLSRSYFSRHWPRKELGTLLANDTDEASRIIPIWHKISFDDVRSEEPLLLNYRAADTSERVPSIADQILRLLKKDKQSGQTIPTPESLTPESVRALTLRLFPGLPVDQFWQKHLLADLDAKFYHSVNDIEFACRRAQPAVEAYVREEPSLFRSGTDHLTKSLGFVDLCFRSRHNWSPQTQAAFVRHADKIKWEIDQ